MRKQIDILNAKLRKEIDNKMNLMVKSKVKLLCDELINLSIKDFFIKEINEFSKCSKKQIIKGMMSIGNELKKTKINGMYYTYINDSSDIYLIIYDSTSKASNFSEFKSLKFNDNFINGIIREDQLNQIIEKFK
ncbi:hypothetical protein HERIO_2267 [Hepatospora eriocheir]|uniref:Uncharacterized protein n=1 Tax=Hepatospora eriocheir TaxID=1081669 RepID=A0A1X0Q7G5_9MICR|nr:hypothetical protein HERIO_2267 [Hepatospora eriocheir]